jgi:Ca-activated chloride channel family protein
LPDLFAGTQLVVVGRYREGGGTSLTLRGEVNGQRQEFRYEDVRLARDGGEEFIARLWATRKIGYLLQQIRLHGEDQELVDEIVELSVRYGIITPYTSFLVEETERALREEGRREIAEAQATAAPAPATGKEGVDRSAGEQALSEAEAPAAPALPEGLGGGETDEYGYEIVPVKYVGDKTFVLNDGVWTDTTFDPDRMSPVPVSFGSDDYFALITARPEWGRYLALGNHVIVVLEDTAYEVREGEAPPLDVPDAEPTPSDGPGVDEATPAVEATPGEEPGADEPKNLGEMIVEVIVTVVEAIVDFFTK